MATHGMNPKVDLEEALAYAAGTLRAQRIAEVEAYLDSKEGAELARSVARYRLAQRTLVTDDTAEVPAPVLDRAKAMFSRLRPSVPQTSWIDRIERLLASVLFDSRVQPMAVRYSRPGVPPDRFSISYQLGSTEVDLQAERSRADSEVESTHGPQWRLIGQVSDMDHADDSPRRIALVRAGTTEIVAEAQTDQSGTFILDATAGSYNIVIEVPEGANAAVMLPAIEIR